MRRTRFPLTSHPPPPAASAGSSGDGATWNVLFVEQAAGFGGSTVALGRLLAALDRSRFRPFVLVSHPLHRVHLEQAGVPAASIVLRDDECLRPLRTPPVTARFLPRLGRPLRGALDWLRRTEPAASLIARVARDCGADLLHLNNSVCTNLGGVVAAQRLGMPCVVKQRGVPWLSPEVRWAARRVDCFLPSSRWIGDTLHAAAVHPSRVRVNWSPIDLAEFEPARDRASARLELGLPSGVPAVGIVACLHEWKGQHVVVEAAPEIVRRVPDARFVIVGGTPEGGETAYSIGLRRRVAELGLWERFVFAGHRADVPRILAALDVVVHASTLPEPFGLSVIEAMAAERPVVAMDCGGPREVIDHGATGLLVPAGDPSAIAVAAAQIVADPELAVRLGSAARAIVAARYAVDVHARRTEAAYTDVLASMVALNASNGR